MVLFCPVLSYPILVRLLDMDHGHGFAALSALPSVPKLVRNDRRLDPGLVAHSVRPASAYLRHIVLARRGPIARTRCLGAPGLVLQSRWLPALAYTAEFKLGRLHMRLHPSHMAAPLGSRALRL